MLINNRHLFLTVLEAEVQCPSTAFSSVLTWQGEGESSFASSYKGSNTIHEASSHDYSTSLRPPLLTPTHQWLEFHHINLGTQTFRLLHS